MRVKGPFLVEIDRLKAVNQQLEIELADQKAITELAVKGLKEISIHKVHSYASSYQLIRQANSILSEIERLQNE